MFVNIDACVSGYPVDFNKRDLYYRPAPCTAGFAILSFQQQQHQLMNFIMAVLTETFSGCIGRRYPVKRSRTEEEEATEHNLVYLSWSGSGNGGNGLCK